MRLAALHFMIMEVKIALASFIRCGASNRLFLRSHFVNKRLFYIALLLGMILLPTLAVKAQAPPDSINAALNDLTNRLGKTVTFADLDSWSFSGEIFPDTSLGCPKSGQ